jgi:hypothetical protein
MMINEQPRARARSGSSFSHPMGHSKRCPAPSSSHPMTRVCARLWLMRLPTAVTMKARSVRGCGDFLRLGQRPADAPPIHAASETKTRVPARTTIVEILFQFDAEGAATAFADPAANADAAGRAPMLARLTVVWVGHRVGAAAGGALVRALFGATDRSCLFARLAGTDARGARLGPFAGRTAATATVAFHAGGPAPFARAIAFAAMTRVRREVRASAVAVDVRTVVSLAGQACRHVGGFGRRRAWMGATIRRLGSRGRRLETRREHRCDDHHDSRRGSHWRSTMAREDDSSATTA